jgi:hypothetical protein
MLIFVNYTQQMYGWLLYYSLLFSVFFVKLTVLNNTGLDGG